MMKFQSRIFRALLALAGASLVVAACAPAAAQPVPQEVTEAPTEAPTEPATEPAPAGTELPPVAALEAQEWLAAHLGVGVEEVDLVGQEQAEWSDSCLGLGQPNESCAAVITPGWLVTLEAAGQTYEVRTDELGTNVRLVPTEVDSELSGTAWALESFETEAGLEPVAVPGSITLEFQPDGQAGGSGGCNSYGAAYETEGGSLSFGQVTSTLMLCADEDLMGQEQQYYAALETASAYTLTGEALTITHANGTLHFAPRSAEGEVPGGSLDEARVPGIIDFHAEGSEGVITAPETVTAGEDFEITLTTFGGGCETAGDTAVVVTAVGADVFVYDLTTATRPDVACTEELKRLTHTVTLRFDEPGEMVIRVWGRRVGPDAPGLGVPTVLEQAVTVE